MYRDKILYDLKGIDLDLGGDGRCDSPGHCAKYGKYTLMELSSKKNRRLSMCSRFTGWKL